MLEIILNPRRRRQLRQQLKHTSDASLYRRLLAVLQIGEGKPVAEVAQALGVTRQSVYNWVECYAATYDPSSLVDAARSGRPSAWTPDLHEHLRTLLGESPTRWGFLAVNWTVPLLRQQLASRDGRWLSHDTIRRQLHELGYVWKRTRYVLPADPDGEKKKGHPPQAEKPARTQRRAGRGRDGPAPVPAAAGGLGGAGAAGPGADQRRQRQAGGLRRPQHPDGDPPAVGPDAPPGR